MLPLIMLGFTIPTLQGIKSATTDKEMYRHFSATDSSTSKFMSVGNKISWSIMGVSILAGILGLTTADHQVWDKTKRLLGWKPKPLNKPANVTVQTKLPPNMPAVPSTTAQPQKQSSVVPVPNQQLSKSTTPTSNFPVAPVQ